MILQHGSTPKVIYDEEADVLYLKFSSNRNSTGHETGSNIIVHFDDATGVMTTVTILDFMWLEKNHPKWKNELPAFIDFDTDVYPLILG